MLVCATLKTIFVIVVSLDSRGAPPRSSFGPASLILAFLRQDPVDGAQLAGTWGTRETFVAVVTTNLPWILTLFKALFRPLFGALGLGSSQKSHTVPPGFRTIGGGGGSSRGRKLGGPPSANPITANLSFTESEEQMVKDVKMQDMKVSATRSSDTQPSQGITVRNEFEITEDRSSHHGEHQVQRVPDTW